MDANTVLAKAAKAYSRILANKKQGVYLYLDDHHKVCNAAFAAMLGYKSAAQWAKVDAPLSDVHPASQDKVAKAFWAAMESGIGSSFDIKFKSRMGKSGSANVILVPVIFGDERLALHFVTKK